MFCSIINKSNCARAAQSLCGPCVTAFCARAVALPLDSSDFFDSPSVLYISIKADMRHAASYKASAAAGDCGCSLAYFSYISASFSGHLEEPCQSPHTLFSIRWKAARLDHLLPGNFFITSFMYT